MMRFVNTWKSRKQKIEILLPHHNHSDYQKIYGFLLRQISANKEDC